VKPAKLLDRVRAGQLANVDFADLVRLVEALGFGLARVSGSHRIYSHPEVAEMLGLQPFRGDAKPYQTRQLVTLVEVYNLSLRGRE